MRARVLPLFGLAIVLAAACGGSAFSNDDATGGATTGTGGSSANGGATVNGGASSSGSSAGGLVGDGGSNAKGGTAATGGSSARGGTTATGGSSAKGGTSSATGGSSRGGASATGGVSAQGGSNGKGGSSAQGGSGKGGSPNSGGTTMSGGSGGSGGTSGGTLSSGGTSSGGSSGASTGGTAGAGGICRLDSDCRISDDCCDCFAAGPGEPTSICKVACKQSACASAGIAESEASCVAGRCVIARSCNPSAILCDAVEPTCPAGQVPSIKGGCWGPCLAPGECSDVSSCKVCDAAGLSCVTIEANAAPVYHCVSKPAACDKNPTCSCMSVCQRPYQCSAPGSTALTCTCLTC